MATHVRETRKERHSKEERLKDTKRHSKKRRVTRRERHSKERRLKDTKRHSKTQM